MFTAALAALLVLAGCGQKGPLLLPDEARQDAARRGAVSSGDAGAAADAGAASGDAGRSPGDAPGHDDDQENAEDGRRGR